MVDAQIDDSSVEAIVGTGLAPGSMAGHRVGVNNNIPSSTFILLSNVTSAASPINFPAAAQQMQVVSTSASDTAAGTGAQQVEITYLTTPAAGFQKKTEIVTLNGATPVLTVNTDIFRIDRFRVSRVGSGLFAVGNVKLQSVGGATTFDQVDAGTNVFRTAIHYVPKGVRTVVTDITIGASTAGGVIFIFEVSESDASGNVVTLGQGQIEVANQGLPIQKKIPYTVDNPNGLLMFVAIVVKGRAANQSAGSSFDFVDIPL